MADGSAPIVGDEFDVFISYAHADKAADSDHSPARTLAAMLEADGYSVWWDRSLIGGQNWLRELSTKVHFARKVIALCSPRWLASQYCRNEMFAAVRVDGKFVPVLIAECTLPAELAHIQYVSAKGDLA